MNDQSTSGADVSLMLRQALSLIFFSLVDLCQPSAVYGNIGRHFMSAGAWGGSTLNLGKQHLKERGWRRGGDK